MQVVSKNENGFHERRWNMNADLAGRTICRRRIQFLFHLTIVTYHLGISVAGFDGCHRLSR